MITAEQVADLCEGDVVELARADNPAAKAAGVVVEINRRLYVGPFMVRWRDGTVPVDVNHLNLTVVSRAPRPLYVNHDRFCPAFGDVVRNAADAGDRRTWQYRDPADTKPWVGESESNVAPFRWWNRRDLPARLRLLVDGETGQVVP